MARDWDDSEPNGPWQNLPSTDTPVPAGWFTAVDEQMEDLADGSTGRVKVLEQKLPAGQVPVTLPEGTTAAVGKVVAVGTVTGGVVTSWELVDQSGGGGGLTAEQVRDTIGAALVQGAGITVTVDDPGDTITIATTVTQYTNEAAQDAVAALIAAGTHSGVTFTYDDAANTLSASILGGRQAAVLYRVLHNGTTYGARPSGAEAGMVEYVGPTTPTSWLAGDTWLQTA